MKKQVSILLLICVAAVSNAQMPSLNAQEKKDGWVLLFDGKDLA